MNFDWAELAFGDKKDVKKLKAIFIAAPREVSVDRFKQLIKEYLPKGNIVLGISKENFVQGLEDQPQFRMLLHQDVEKIIGLINKSKSSYKIYSIRYFQRELKFLIQKLGFIQVLLINGSWYKVFHVSPAFYALVTEQIPYKLLSAFTNEEEARQYEKNIQIEIKRTLKSKIVTQPSYSEQELLAVANQVATLSFDYGGFQTGLVLAKLVKKGQYNLLASTYNKVVPFETYAMLHGSSREINFSPPNDLNYYDTLHAEVELIVEMQKKKKDLHDTTIFMNLLPCPTCTRMLIQTDISELVYTQDHSDGYAVQLLEKTGKKVRRVIPNK